MRVRTLTSHDAMALRQLLLRDPITHCFAASRIVAANGLVDTDPWRIGGELLGCFADGELLSAVYAGANVIPIETTFATREAFITHLAKARAAVLRSWDPRLRYFICGMGSPIAGVRLAKCAPTNRSWLSLGHRKSGPIRRSAPCEPKRLISFSRRASRCLPRKLAFLRCLGVWAVHTGLE